jgi:hypothetical protein
MGFCCMRFCLRVFSLLWFQVFWFSVFEFALLFLSAAEAESLHLLSKLTESSEFEGFRKTPASHSTSSESPKLEPWLRNCLRNHLSF